MATIHLEFAPEDIRTFFNEIRETQREAKKMINEATDSMMSHAVGTKTVSVEVEGLGELIEILREQMSMAKGFMDPEMVNAIKQSVLTAAKHCTNKCKLDDLEKKAAEEKKEETKDQLKGWDKV